MQSSLNKTKNSQIQLTVELNQTDLSKYMTEAVDVLAENFEVKGFRKGRAPRDLIEKKLNQKNLRSLALQLALEGSLADAIKDNSLDVLDTSKLSVEENNSQYLKYSIMIDLFPEVNLIDIKNVKIKRKDIKIEESEIRDAIETIRNSRATFVDKNDDVAGDGDRVEVDFEVKKDGQIIDGGISKNHPLVIGGKSFIPGFEDQLIGMKKGEVKEFSLVVPEDYFYKEVAGKKLDFKIQVVELKRVIKPEINDKFVISLGNFSGINELRKSIEEGLGEEKRFKENQKLRLEALEKIISLSKIELPGSLVKKQLDIMLADFDNSLHARGLELGLYLARIGKTEDEMRNDWTKDAEKQVKISLVLRRLAKDEKINTSKEEVDEVASQLIQAGISRGEIAPDSINLAKIKEEIESKIVNEKTLQYIEDHCVVA